MSSTESAGSAFVEVHARAAKELQREMSAPVTAAVQRTELEAMRVERASQGKRMSASHYFEERKRIVAVAEAERAAKGQIAAGEKVVEAARKRGSSGGFADSTAKAYLFAKAVQFLTSSVEAYLEAGDRGLITDVAQQRNYRETSIAAQQMATGVEKAKVAVGGFIAKNVNPFSSDFRKGVVALKNPLDTLAVGLGITTKGTKDLARQFGAIDADQPAETLREIERRAAAVQAQFELTRKSVDRQAEGAVSAARANFEMVTAQDRVTEASVRVAEAQAKVNDSRGRAADEARRLVDAEREIHEAREALADQAQEAIEKDRAVDAARSKVRVAQFTAGPGSQAAIDAANELQSAEFEAKRAREETGDAAADVKAREQDLGKVRVETANEAKQATSDLRDAQKDLDDALRNSAQSAADYRTAVLNASGAEVTAVGKAQLLAEEMEKIAGVAGPRLRTELDLIKKALQEVSGLPPDVAAMLPDLQGAMSPPGPAPIGAAGGGNFGALAPPGPNRPTALAPPGPATPTVLAPPGPAPVSMTFNEKVDPMHVAAEVAWHGRI